MFKVAVAALLFSGTEAALRWVKTGGGDPLCAAINDPCEGEDCTEVLIGSCGGDATEASKFISTTWVSLAFVGDEATYNTDSSQVNLIDPTPQSDSFTNFYRDFADGDEYTFVATGAWFGSDPSAAGGYVGVASYVMKDGSIATNINQFYVAETPGAARTDRSGDGGSKYGAPDGPFDVCVSEISNGNCGGQTTYTAGDYKFSIYGFTHGSDYESNTADGADGMPETVNYLGVRTKLTLGGFSSDAIFRFNGDLTLDELANSDVTSFTVSEGNETLAYVFPTEYNVGSITNEVDGVLIGDETKTVKIKAHAVEGDDMSVHIDYLFDKSDLAVADRYFVYDPTVTATINDEDNHGSRVSIASAVMVLVTLCVVVGL